MKTRQTEHIPHATSPRALALVCFVVVLATTTGCAGGRYSLKADQARYPMSFSQALEGPNHERLVIGDGLERVGRFRTEVLAYGYLYSAIPWPVDISEAVNTQIEAVGGEGLAEMRVINYGCDRNWFFPLTLLPIWPGCTEVIVEGGIVRRTSDVAEPGKEP